MDHKANFKSNTGPIIKRTKQILTYNGFSSYIVAELWSYASHSAQCGVFSSQSTCCGCCIRDYHIFFRLFALSNPSVLTLCLKNPRYVFDTIQPDLVLMVR